MATTEAVDVDLLDPLYQSGVPHKLYAALRESGTRPLASPEHTYPLRQRHRVLGRARPPRGGTREPGLGDVHRDRRPDDLPFPPKPRGVMIVTKDPPDHTHAPAHQRRFHAPHDRAPRRTDPRAHDRSSTPPPAGDLDFVQDVAYQLPMHVIADIIGIPEADRPEVFR